MDSILGLREDWAIWFLGLDDNLTLSNGEEFSVIELRHVASPLLRKGEGEHVTDLVETAVDILPNQVATKLLKGAV